MNNFQLNVIDTDSISFCRQDGSFIPREERSALIKEINSLSPEFMEWSDDGYYSKVIVLKTKNYILKDETGKITYKGSSLKDQKKEIAIKEFLHKVIDIILNE